MSPVYDLPSNQEMCTPRWFVKQLESHIGTRFQLDAFASKRNTICRRFYDVQKNGLAHPWRWTTFCNSPFKLVKRAIAKAPEDAQNYDVVVVLIGPAGCSQRWFHEHALHGTILVPTHRLIFLNDDLTPSTGAMADNAVYIFGGPWWNTRGNIANGKFDVHALEVPDGAEQRELTKRRK